MICDVITVLACACTVYASNIQVEYFTSAMLACDNSEYNLTISAFGQETKANKYWITPSGSIISNESIPEPTRRGDPSWDLGDFFFFNLTVNYVDDDDFGVYYCVVVDKDYSLIVIKQGLNVNGPSYERLYERYRHNAMIGGIAAAVLFSIIFSFCVIWQFRYSKKVKARKEGIEYREDGLDNSGMDMHSVNGEKSAHGFVSTEKL